MSYHSEEFPKLEIFADMLYEEDGETYIKTEYGTWAIVPVCEGFFQSQGCPVSPLFAALVLNCILRKIQPELEERAKHQLTVENEKGNDLNCSVGLIMACVDDVNALIHHDNVEFFLNRFDELAKPKGGS